MAGLSHITPAYTDKAAPFIEEHGGKIGGLEAIMAHIPSLRDRILELTIIGPDDHYDFRHPRGPWIVRSSHPHDFQGLVDVFETRRCVRRTEIAAAIHDLRADSARDPVWSYARYENPAYQDRVTVGVQEDYGHNTGDMVEHPNRPGHYLITWVQGEGRGASRTTALYNDEGRKLENVSGMGQPLAAEALVSMYRLIRKADIVRDDVSFQMEFGWKSKKERERDLRIYQIRAFAKKQVADWQIRHLPKWWKGLAFGVTPPEGLILPVQTWDELDRHESPPPDMDVPWALHKLTHAHHHSFKFQPGPQFAAYLVGRQHGSGMVDANLQHGHFKLAQEADVTVYESQFAEQCFPSTQKIRLLCDGVRFAVEAID